MNKPSADPGMPALLVLLHVEGDAEIYRDWPDLLAFRPDAGALAFWRVTWAHPLAAPCAGRRLTVEGRWAMPSPWCRWSAMAVEALQAFTAPEACQ